MKIIIVLSLVFTFSVMTFGQKTSIKVYFTNESLGSKGCDGKVFPVRRKITRTKAVARGALDELFKGPTANESERGFESLFSEATKGLVISIRIYRGIAYVNLKQEIVEKLGSATSGCGGISYNSSVLRTLKQFPGVKKVMFAIEKDPALYYDWMQIGECPKELKNCSNQYF